MVYMTEFLTKLIDDKKSVWVFLINGVKLQGTIVDHDPAGGILLERRGRRQLVYGHAISTISEDTSETSSQ